MDNLRSAKAAIGGLWENRNLPKSQEREWLETELFTALKSDAYSSMQDKIHARMLVRSLYSVVEEGANLESLNTDEYYQEAVTYFSNKYNSESQQNNNDRTLMNNAAQQIIFRRNRVGISIMRANIKAEGTNTLNQLIDLLDNQSIFHASNFSMNISRNSISVSELTSIQKQDCDKCAALFMNICKISCSNAADTVSLAHAESIDVIKNHSALFQEIASLMYNHDEKQIINSLKVIISTLDGIIPDFRNYEMSGKSKHIAAIMLYIFPAIKTDAARLQQLLTIAD